MFQPIEFYFEEYSDAYCNNDVVKHDVLDADKKESRVRWEVLFVKIKTSIIIGVTMLIIAIGFVAFAMSHPELSFPW